MRARGESLQTYGVDEIIEQNGVVKGSYDEVQLPKIRAFNVMYKHPSMTKPAEAFEVKSTPLPPTLEWGQVLINVKAASIGPGDIHPLFASSMDPGASIFEAVHFFSNPNFLTLSSNSPRPLALTLAVSPPRRITQPRRRPCVDLRSSRGPP